MENIIYLRRIFLFISGLLIFFFFLSCSDNTPKKLVYNQDTLYVYPKANGERVDWYTAKKICKELDAFGHKDWYLPSRNELEFIYGIEDALPSDKSFWSSTEESHDKAILLRRYSVGSGYGIYSFPKDETSTPDDGAYIGALQNTKISCLCLRKTVNPQEFKDQNVSFTYPTKWETVSPDIYEMLHKPLEQELLKMNRRLLEMSVFHSPLGENRFLVFDKTQVTDSVTIAFLFNERKNEDNNAISSGYLKKINVLQLKKINGEFFLIEDILGKEVRNYSIRTVINSIIYTFSLTASDDDSFQEEKQFTDKIIESFRKI